jgi:hypothetical protein
VSIVHRRHGSSSGSLLALGHSHASPAPLPPSPFLSLSQYADAAKSTLRTNMDQGLTVISSQKRWTVTGRWLSWLQRVRKKGRRGGSKNRQRRGVSATSDRRNYDQQLQATLTLWLTLSAHTHTTAAVSSSCSISTQQHYHTGAL